MASGSIVGRLAGVVAASAIVLSAGFMVGMGSEGPVGPNSGIVTNPAQIIDGPVDPDNTNWVDVANTKLVLKDSTAQAINLPSGDLWAPFIAPVNLGGQAVELWLEPHSVRSPDNYRAQAMGANGEVVVLDDITPRTYKGTIPTIPGAEVRASLIDGQLFASVRMLDGSGYHIQPLSDVASTAPHNLHAVYLNSDALPQGGTCGVDDTVSSLSLRSSGSGRSPAPRDIGGFRQLEVGMEVDFQYYQLQGSSTTNVINDVENMMNQVEGIYNGENLNINVEVTTINIRTVDAAPYLGVTNPNSLLTAFQGEWNPGGNVAVSTSVIKRDVAHMFTNKPIDSGTGTIGIAFVGTVCQSGAGAASYGLSKSRFSNTLLFRTAVTAHEIGHNLSCTHCNNTPFLGDGVTANPCNNQGAGCGLMCTAVASCAGPANVFGACNVGQAISYRDTSGGCMIATPAFQTLPFIDSFEPSIDPTKWIWNQNTAVVVPPVALRPAPDGTNVLNPNAITLSGVTISDSIRSNFMSLTGVTDASVTFSWARIGIPNGGALIVDYWANNIRWTELGRLTSDGVNSTGWTVASFPVPATGQWGQFRFRFRVTGSTTTAQNWYVDKIRVGSPPPPTQCNPADICGVGATYNNGAVDVGPDNALTIEDFLNFLSAFGDSTGCPGSAPCNPADICGVGATYNAGAVDVGPDGALTIEDFLNFLSAFGDATGCP